MKRARTSPPSPPHKDSNDHYSASKNSKHKNKNSGPRSGYWLVVLLVVAGSLWILWFVNYQPATDDVFTAPYKKADLPYPLKLGKANANAESAVLSRVRNPSTIKDQGAAGNEEVAQESDKGNKNYDPRFVFVHIGKAGGSTIQNNIMALCLRRNVEIKIKKQLQFQKKVRQQQNTSAMLNMDNGSIICLRDLRAQGNPEKHDPSSEMKLSLGPDVDAITMTKMRKKHTRGNVFRPDHSRNYVIGSFHMNSLPFWWNANDDRAAKNQRGTIYTIQDQISAILSRGDAYSFNATVLRNPPSQESIAESHRTDTGMRDSTAFLAPVRDPVNRLVSAFNYHHPENHLSRSNCADLAEELSATSKFITSKYKAWVHHSFYCSCFPTVNELVDVFQKDDESSSSNTNNVREVPSFSDPTATVACLDIATRVLRGKSHYKPNNNNIDNSGNDDAGFAADHALDLRLLDGQSQMQELYIGHISLNYGFYYRRALARFPEKELVAIRTEHLMEDLQQLEYKLGGHSKIEGEATGHVSRDYGSSTFTQSAKVTDPARVQVLCCAIRSEAEIYREMIERASNLSDAQKKESLGAFAKRCNLELCSV